MMYTCSVYTMIVTMWWIVQSAAKQTVQFWNAIKVLKKTYAIYRNEVYFIWYIMPFCTLSFENDIRNMMTSSSNTLLKYIFEVSAAFLHILTGIAAIFSRIQSLSSPKVWGQCLKTFSFRWSHRKKSQMLKSRMSYAGHQISKIVFNNVSFYWGLSSFWCHFQNLMYKMVWWPWCTK
jgi:hypothetical protein